ncbi:uncharacterized protein LOC115990959 [Quercus lobata]|uniref:uncharacterized protein LOC115990959 n=1 Tax=Quercus lobata TaxID=97700 RepID=UPI001246CEBE|nr:uncharacterized protein LOC115990959 [Quercus lobata]
MNSLGWNCRGLGNPRSVRALHNLVQYWAPKLVFLSETKVRKKRMERIKERIGFANGLFVPCHGRSGGLALLWTRETDLEIKSFSNHHIDAVITEENSNFKWRFTGFYGHPQTHLRQKSWDLLDFLQGQSQLPWFCFGDFNEILSMEEKTGGAIRSQGQMDKFREVVNVCGFKDLGYMGPDFTWCNMQTGDSRVYLRLDRAFATCDWINKFGEVRVNHLVDSTSDHCALYVVDPKAPKRSRTRRFHFEAMWTKKEECKDIIKAAWSSASNVNTAEGMAAA